LYNKFFVTIVGSNTDLFCRIDKRHKESEIYIGKNCLINGRLVTEINKSRIIIKDNVFIGGKTIIDCKDEILIEDNVLISYECIIADHDSHSLNSSKRENDLYKFKKNKMNWHEVNSKKITIKKNAWICTRSIILKGITIGEGAIVAAGSVVTKNVENFTLVAGNPAIFIKKVN
jgi:acetyltransferase-like isoleucine patch superfamily enzyme